MTPITLLRQAQHDLNADTDPDGPNARGALLLSARILADAATVDDGRADMRIFSSIAIQEAIDQLVEDLTDDLVFAADLPPMGTATAETVIPQVKSLLGRLATLYADAAAANNARSSWRKLIWASVADHIDRAIEELP